MRLKKNIILFFLLCGMFNVYAQNFPVYEGFESFKPVLENKDNKVYVINFWATWCRPCVKEMPAFNKLYEEYHNKNVEIILVSLDFGKNIQGRISEFKKRHGIKSKIVILDDPDSNSWINLVNNNWSGAIPATLIYNNSKRAFFEQEFEYEDLETELKKFL